MARHELLLLQVLYVICALLFWVYADRMKYKYKVHDDARIAQKRDKVLAGKMARRRGSVLICQQMFSQYNKRDYYAADR